MSQALETQLVSTITDENGSVSASKSRVEKPDIEVDINIRQDDLQMFWADGTDLLLRTSDMSEGVYIQPIPTEKGYQCEIVVEPDVTLTETEPAIPAEMPDVSESNVEIRMD